MNSPFNYPDTNSSRAKIDHINKICSGMKVAIIGLGGTGSYILDLLAKTWVQEIHLYDTDSFQLHNAFRTPGAVDGSFLDNNVGIKKINYLYDIYSKMHNGITVHDEYVKKENIEQLKNLDFVFVSIDKNAARSEISNGLLTLGIPHIDCGMGINEVQNRLTSGVRTTTVTKNQSNHAAIRFGGTDDDDDLYGSNIQIAELNCLNATLAVIRWKRMIGYYASIKNEHNSIYTLTTNAMHNEDYTT
jgi:hypothetical protein